MIEKVDLLQSVQYGGCSAKIPAAQLESLLGNIPLLKSNNILVDTSTHDDAGVYRLNGEQALIVTTDFFPPICSDPFEFGQIAATNSLSDVYAMGGKPLLVLNLNMFPSQTMPLSALREIILGGQDKVSQAGAFTMGGHTIDDSGVKYGLAVVGIVHPDHVISNSGAKAGDVLILTKALGSGVLVAAQRMGIAPEQSYREAIEAMKLLNDRGAELMQQFIVRGATDITGFGLLGHLRSMALASGVSMEIDSTNVPLLPNVADLLEDGCVPSSAFKNLEFVVSEVDFASWLPLSGKMALCDAQTSGGLLMSVQESKAPQLLELLHEKYPSSRVVGRVVPHQEKAIYVV
ncbi:MAG: selenide, water dikinase SelD [Mucinivorans sp.]